MNLMTLLQLAENLGQSPKQWIVCGIVADSEHLLLHDSLSPAVAEAMPKLLSYIQQVCSAYSESTI
jgi:Ni,Fe-hydrogenase maturation factor